MLKRRVFLSHVLATGTLLAAVLGSVASCGKGESAEPSDPAQQLPLSVPPPISGGTLLILPDGVTAVAADPDRDSVWIVDLEKERLGTRVRTRAGGEPGRLVADQDGNVHVALRRGGEVVSIDPRSGTVLASRRVCAAPRGLAYEAGSDNLHVACAGGELATLKARGGEVLRTLFLGPDLRDIVISGEHLLVSRFRSAEVLELDGAGVVIRQSRPSMTVGPVLDMRGAPVQAAPTQAYRMAALPGGGAVMLHQRSVEGNPVPTKTASYGSGGGPCQGAAITSTALTTWGSDLSGGGRVSSILPTAGASFDVAVSRDSKSLAVIGIGVRGARGQGTIPVAVLDYALLAQGNPCTNAGYAPNSLGTGAEYIAGAYDDKGVLWVQSRQPAQLDGLRSDRRIHIELSGAEDRSDAGHKLFHTPTLAHLACVSCHGEVGDDGHVWNFESIGPRRTQSLRGGLLATAPFHWDGNMHDLTELMTEVFVNRMGGGVTADGVAAIGRWLDAQPALPKSAPRDPQAVSRGKALFEDPVLLCVTCHGGPRFTNNQTVDVGTGRALQVPSLIDVPMRAPYLHNGCGKSLRDRFNPNCGGGDLHGKTSHLTAGQTDDLVAYLETL